jgi:lactoylglutathione lyase
MIINHINLTVTDVVEAARFLEKYFGMQNPYEEEDNPKMMVLFDDNQLVLTLMKGAPTIKYPNSFHIGFMQATDEEVNELNRRLKEDGFDVEPPKRLHAWTFYVEAPGGFMVEIAS